MGDTNPFCVIIHAKEGNPYTDLIKDIAMEMVNTDVDNNVCVVNTIPEDMSALTYKLALNKIYDEYKVPTHIISIEGDSVRMTDLTLLSPGAYGTHDMGASNDY